MSLAMIAGSPAAYLLYRRGRSSAVVERRRMAFAGCAFIAIAMDEKGELADDPEIELIGVPEKNVAGEAIDDIVFDIVVSTVEGLPRHSCWVRMACWLAHGSTRHRKPEVLQPPKTAS